MGLYQFKHPKKEKYVEVFQKMQDEHVFVDDKGITWERVWSVPQAKITITIDPNNPNSFLDATSKIKGSIGDLCDLSQECGNKRSKHSDNERDKVKDKFSKNPT